MKEQFQRTVQLIGEEACRRLSEARVIVFGIGGVGSYVCEALARAGIGYIEIVDKDEVDITNINRQIIVLHSTVGRHKVDVEFERIKDINTEISVEKRQCFYLPESADRFNFEEYDYVIDAVDNVTAKIDIIRRSKAAGTRVISSMGTGNKLNPMAFKVAYVEDTKVCPLAKVMRRELKKLGITGVKAVYSEEEPIKNQSSVPASISFVPSAAGLLIASEVIKDLIEIV